MDLADFLSKYWQLITAGITLVVGYTTIRVQNADQEKRISKLEERVEHMNPVVMEIRERLASIEATLNLLAKK